MAVAAYASLVSLTHVLHNIHYRAQLRRLSLGTEQIETLQGKVQFLLDFVELHSQIETQEMKSLWSKMAEVAREVEEMIDLHVVDEIRCRFEECKSDVGISSFHQDMEGVLQKIDLIKNELSMIVKGTKDVRARKQSTAAVPASSSTFYSSSKDIMVGFDGYMVDILDELTNNEENLQIIPIVGMGGIGKTTLAQSIFTHPLAVHRFCERVWITVSQEYTVQQILLGLLSEDVKKESDNNQVKLGERLRKKLYGRRYLIVMDDVWSTDAWNDLKMFFPNNRNGSRVMITTRLSNVVGSLGCQNLHSINFLNEDLSWNLFCQTTFAQECCPYPKLEEIGKNIAKSCKGLPLALVVIASLLSKSNMTCEYWELVARNVNSFGNLEDDERCLKILSLSYTDLPIHLKPCFLYMRVFREDERIDVSSLIKLWIAEGFIKLVNNKSLEEIAEHYFNDLVSRNLIFIRERNINKEPERCGIHDLLRDLCLREFSKEKFTWTPLVQRIEPDWRKRCCFICAELLDREKEETNSLDLMLLSPSRSRVEVLVCDACNMMYPHIARTRAIKAIGPRAQGFHREFVQPTQLKHLLVDSSSLINIGFVSPSTLHLLWNLHTIEIYSKWLSPSVLPSKFWELSQLRHFKTRISVSIKDPPIHEKEKEDFMIMRNLQTLSRISNFKCTKEVLARIPNVKSLSICYGIRDREESVIEWPKYSLRNLVQLSKLESLKVQKVLLDEITFSKSLKKLVLYDCNISWDTMRIIGSLPCLEILELFNYVEEFEWNPVEGEFLQLKGLLISWRNLEWWRADAIHFPRLEWLILEHIEALVEIPSSIGDIETLHTIKVKFCNDTVVESARQLWEEQQNLGNKSLQILVSDNVFREYQIGDFKSAKIEEDCDDS